MPRLVARSYYGLVHHSIEYGPPRSHHLGEPFGRTLSVEEIGADEARQGIDALVIARELPRGFHGT